MKYMVVRWNHEFDDEPALLYSELDEFRFETRKVEIFPDGEIGYANGVESFGTTQLGSEPVPAILEIAEDPQFEPQEITREEFEKIWMDRKKKGH